MPDFRIVAAGDAAWLVEWPARIDPAVSARVSWFADHRLGKGVVVAKDTPNFIGNHIGLYGVAQVLRALESGKYTIEEIDAITGPALGRPNSATFRTMDIAGIDVLSHVAANLKLELPAFVGTMIERGWVGEKAGQGFYKKEKSATGAEILTLDPATLTYRAKQPARIPSLEAARAIDDTAERIRTIYHAESPKFVEIESIRYRFPLGIRFARVLRGISFRNFRSNAYDAIGAAHYARFHTRIDLIGPKLRNFFLMIMPGPWISQVDNPGHSAQSLYSHSHEM